MSHGLKKLSDCPCINSKIENKARHLLANMKYGRGMTAYDSLSPNTNRKMKSDKNRRKNNTNTNDDDEKNCNESIDNKVFSLINDHELTQNVSKIRETLICCNQDVVGIGHIPVRIIDKQTHFAFACNSVNYWSIRSRG